jgi:beta-N-acetylhexosaminidase
MSHDIAEAGDHFLVGLQLEPELTARDRALLRDLRPAGIVLFKPNFRQDVPYVTWLASQRTLLDGVRQAIGRDRFLVAIDHEGGRVIRTPEPITRFAYAAHWADRSADVARAMARELRSIGVNLSFAPVLDVHSNPANPVIGARAFGTTPEAVIAAALPFMRALEAEGVIACGKHFPGHGDTATDSHYELPVIERSVEDLRARELLPFAAAIEAGLSVVMTSHILFPALDAAEPATLSRPIMAELLRREMGFSGVIVTDDIGMRAVSKMFDAPSAPARALNAGVDILTVCAHWTDTERCRGFAAGILEAEQNGTLPADARAASRARIGRLLDRTGTHPVERLPQTDFDAHARIAPLHGSTTAATTV